MVVALVAVLAAVAMDRMLRYLELAERSAMETTASTLRSAMALRFAAAYLGGTPADIDALGTQNPFDWLAERPGNYAGEFANPNLDEVEKGTWYFDSVGRTAVYVPQRTRYLRSAAAPGDTRIPFKAALRFERAGIGSERVLTQLGFAPVQNYDWSIESD